MTLVISRNNKPDTRMIEYDQAVVRLGLEKEKARADVQRLRVEAAEIGERKACLLDEIVEAQKQLVSVQQEILKTVELGKRDVEALGAAQVQAGKMTDEVCKKLVDTESYLRSLQDAIATKQWTITSVQAKLDEERRVLDVVRGDIDMVLSLKRMLESDVVALKESKRELVCSVESANERLTYLAEKEQSLNRRERDLQKYEERVQKMRDEVGSKSKMVFQ